MLLSQQYLSKLTNLAYGEKKVILPVKISDFDSLLLNIGLDWRKEDFKL